MREFQIQIFEFHKEDELENNIFPAFDQEEKIKFFFSHALAGYFIADIETSFQILHKNSHQTIHVTRTILCIADVISPHLSCNRIQIRDEHFQARFLSPCDVIMIRITFMHC